MVSGRSFQAGAKIWAVVTSLLVACLMVLHYAPALVQGQEVNLLQAYMAAVLSMSERTEATASKVGGYSAGFGRLQLGLRKGRGQRACQEPYSPPHPQPLHPKPGCL